MNPDLLAASRITEGELMLRRRHLVSENCVRRKSGKQGEIVLQDAFPPYALQTQPSAPRVL